MEMFSYLLGKKSGGGGGGGGTPTDVQINGTSITSSNVANIITNGTYNASTNKIATMGDLPGDIVIDFNGQDADNLVELNKFYKLYTSGLKNSFIVVNADTNDRTCEVYFAGTNNSTYVDFEGMYKASYGSGNYGVNYNIFKKLWIRLTISNGEVTSYTKTNSDIYGYLPLFASQILGMSNTTEYEPVDDYNPATKKYVDDKGPSVVVLTETEYNNLSTYADNTEYHIIED